MTQKSPGCPQPVPGLSAAALALRSLRWLVLAGLCVVPVVFESYLPSRWVGAWATLWLLISVSLGGLFLRDTWSSRTTQHAEIKCGYTTSLPIANNDTSLFLLDGKTLQILAGPREPRPANTRKPETAKALARRAAQGAERPRFN